MPYPYTMLLLAALLLPSSLWGQEGEGAAFDYGKFKDDPGLLFSADARERGKKIRLTPAQPNRRGGLWYSNKKMFVADSFSVSFCFRIYDHGGPEGPSGMGGEGLAFVIHNNENPGKNGAKGAGLGYGGIANSLAIELDAQGDEGHRGPHVSVQSRGWQDNRADSAATWSLQPIAHTDIKDEQQHYARITYKNPYLSVFLDGRRILYDSLDISRLLNLDEGAAWAGVTAATGKQYSAHELSCFQMHSVPPPLPYHPAVAQGREMKRGSVNRIVVHSRHIRIRLWDINQEDGDIVSLNLNGGWAVREHTLSQEGAYFDFTLDGQLNYLVLHAHNLGEIPPNTAGISVSDGIGKEREYTLRSNLYASDALLIEYHHLPSEPVDITRKSGSGKKDLKMDRRSNVYEIEEE